MLRRGIFLAATLALVSPAFAATVTVQPPSYTITPPKFSFTLPDTIGGAAGVSVKSATITNGHLILTLSNGTTIDSGVLPVAPAPVVPTVDLSGITSQLSSLSSAVAALQAQIAAGTPVATPPVVVTPTPVSNFADPCANGATWSTLSVPAGVSLGSVLACAKPGFDLTLADGSYNTFHVGTDGYIHGARGHADKVIVDGHGGCTVDQNNGGGCGTRLAYGKGSAHTSANNIKFSDMTFQNGGSNATGNHDGQAGLYLDTIAGSSGKAEVVHCIFLNNENGMFSNGGNVNQDIVITESDFKGNGTDGGSHSSYLAGAKTITFNNIHDYGSNLGNNQKSRASIVTYNGGYNKSVQGRWIECADGCTLVVNGGDFVGNNCCQNMFGNGTESTSKGPGNTTWNGPSNIWLLRATDFSNAGSFTWDASVAIHACGGSIFNDKGNPLNGGTMDTVCLIPSDPPFISLTGTM